MMERVGTFLLLLVVISLLSLLVFLSQVLM
jgi:hypothetical protein